MTQIDSPLAAEKLRQAREAEADDTAFKALTDCPHGCVVPELRSPCEHGYMTASYTLYMEGFRSRHAS